MKNKKKNKHIHTHTHKKINKKIIKTTTTNLYVFSGPKS